MHVSATSHAPAAARQVFEGPRLVHVPLPGAPVATLHAWQAPAQAESQQTPLTQKPFEHWLSLVQVRPSAFFAEQYVPEQYVVVGQPEVQRIGQSRSVPLQTSMPHAGDPGSLAGAGSQVPAVRLQRSQLPEQDSAQHTPSAQEPDEHSVALVHATPRTFTGRHTPAPQ